MPDLLFYGPTWMDRAFKKSFKRLSKREKDKVQLSLASLLEALHSCAHPALDPSLSQWRPTSYKGVASIADDGKLVEYRLPRLTRVIACYFEDNPSDTIDRIVLVTVTIKHDHDRMKRLIQQHRKDLKEGSD